MHPEQRYRLQLFHVRIDVRHDDALGNLQIDAGRSRSEPERFLDGGDEIAFAQLNRGDVHRDAGRGQPPDFPVAVHEDGAAQRPGADLHDQPCFLEKRNEIQRRHQAQFRALPADQGLDAVDAPGYGVDRGLVVQHEFLFLERLPQLVFQGERRPGSLGHVRRVEQVLLPGRLRSFQRRFGIPEQGVRVGTVVGKQRIPGLGRSSEIGAAYPKMRTEAFCKPLLDQPRHFTLGTYIRAKDREAVGADPRHPHRPCVALDAFGNLLDQLVARVPAERVVDRLEPVDVHENQSEFALIGVCRAHVLHQALVKQGAVGQAGERIVVGEVVELFLILSVVERERDVARELQQQFHLVVVEEPALARIQCEDADCRALDQQRHDGQGIDSALGALLFRHHVCIVLNVVRDHGCFFPDRPSGQAVSFKYVAPYVERSGFEVTLRGAAPGHRRHLHRFAVHHAHPRHPELPCLYHDPARFAEQLVAAALPDDECVDPAQHRVDPVEALDFLLRLLARRDVAGDGDDDISLAGRDHAAERLHGKGRSVLAAVDALDAGRRRVPEHQPLIAFDEVGSGHRKNLGLTYREQLLAAVAQGPAHCIVDVDIANSPGIDQRDQVRGRVDGGAELPQFLISRYLFGDVPAGAPDPVNLTRAIADRECPHVEPAHGSVGTHDAVLMVDAPRGRVQRLPRDPFGVVRVDDPQKVAPVFRWRIAGDLVPGGADVAYLLAADLAKPEYFRNISTNLAEQTFARSQFILRSRAGLDLFPQREEPGHHSAEQGQSGNDGRPYDERLDVLLQQIDDLFRLPFLADGLDRPALP